MTEIRDRVAKALCERIWPTATWEKEAEHFRDNYKAAAIEAIKALRDPTEKMIVAVKGRSSRKARIACWHEMVDEALR